MTQASDLRGITLGTVAAGLIAGTTTTYTTTGIVTGAIAGVFATPLAAQTNTATPTTQGDGSAFTALAASQGTVFVCCITAAGAIAVFQGEVETLDSANEFLIAPAFPIIDLETYLPFGYMVIKAASTASAWTFGASNWTATGITDTFADLMTMPRRPVVL
jgi:hypothetical protein